MSRTADGSDDGVPDLDTVAREDPQAVRDLARQLDDPAKSWLLDRLDDAQTGGSDR